MTRQALIIMFRNASFEIGAHHGTSSDGTLILKILIRYIIRRAIPQMETALIKYLTSAI